jgi:hypothetical protein
MRRIRTEARLPFPPEKVWSVLVDFDRYAEWNPLNVWASGQARLGARVPMRFVDAGGAKRKVIAQTVVVTRCEPPHRLEWVGHIPLLFGGRHMFRLEADAGGTRLMHGEDLTGLIPMLFSNARLERQRQAYAAMNEALEQRVAALTSR